MTSPLENYDGLIEAFAARKAAVCLSDESLDALIGWASGYTGKLMGVTPSKRLGIGTMFECAQALGLEITVREIPGAIEKIQQRCGKRDERRVVRLNIRMNRLPWLISKENADLMAEARRAIPPEKRRRLAKKAAMARWKLQRVKRKLRQQQSQTEGDK